MPPLNGQQKHIFIIRVTYLKAGFPAF